MIQEIRKKLRLAMNGVSSSAMREKGVQYKLNFGVPIMTLRKIAQNYTPDTELAEKLWKEDTRELKLLATMIQPPQTFLNTFDWIKGINNLELAEQSSMNLFSKVPNASTNALELIKSKELYPKICGFLIYTRLFMNNYHPGKDKEEYFTSVYEALNSDSLLLRNAALTSLKKLGRQSDDNAKEILDKYVIEKSIYEDLKFEFNYYS